MATPTRLATETLALISAELDSEAKQAGERAGMSLSPFREFHWQNRCSEAAETIRELIARREGRG